MSTETLPSEQADAGGSVFSSKNVLRVFFEKWPLAVLLALSWIALLVIIVAFAPFIAPYDYLAISLTDRLAPPLFLGGGWAHPLGTDELGRDVLSRLLMSVRISIVIAFLSTLIAATLGVSLGFIAAYFRGKVEQLVLMLIDAQAAMPFMIIALAVLAFFGNSLMLFTILMGFYGWERIARIARGLALSANEQGYATAVRDIGASPWRIYGRHILPNIASTLIVSMTLNFPEVILLESGLSFLGLGVQPPLSSLGNMVGYGRDYIQSAPWIMLAPSVVIVLTTLAISIVGDWLRDLFDPTLS
ncbi:ABC transporter permease [Chelativorans sp. YIM 93263]|uniref:ABC transporter permease n=1 Tax=Chelativorans sp. YIM 93263 TaxID=2906648 RepID=UPI0023791B84|nr:ABC transporter permease [Chelativorans sp. YIM 93263]